VLNEKLIIKRQPYLVTDPKIVRPRYLIVQTRTQPRGLAYGGSLGMNTVDAGISFKGKKIRLEGLSLMVNFRV
jgi:hypothetical protein